jgi:hypothetical protein
VASLQPGEAVFGVVTKPVLGDGAFGAYVTNPETYTARVPAGLDLAVAGVRRFRGGHPRQAGHQHLTAAGNHVEAVMADSPEKFAKVFRAANTVVRPLLRSRLHGVLSGRLMLLDYTGGKTGRRYSFPVGYFSWDGGDVLAFSTGRWPGHIAEGRQTGCSSGAAGTTPCPRSSATRTTRPRCSPSSRGATVRGPPGA